MPFERLKPFAMLEKERLAQLKNLIPEAVADGKINWQTLREILDEQLEEVGNDAEHFGLFWPGKRKARQLASLPSKGTLAPVSGEGVNEENTENIFIEGDNLEVLKLLQKSYAGRIKMIYIDPPYNTGNDFIYKDTFRDSIDDYLKKTNQVDDEGKLLTTNLRTEGRFHSNWLNMMYPRLRVARNLLKEDGIMFVSIDDNEVHNLHLLMNEIFGEENFLATFVWKRRSGAMDAVNNVSTDHEYVFCYGKDNISLMGKQRTFESYQNPDNDPRGDWIADNLSAAKPGGNTLYAIKNPITGYEYWPPKGRYWPYNPETMQRKIEEKRIIFPSNSTGSPLLKRFRNEAKSLFRPISTWITSSNDSNDLNQQTCKGIASLTSSINSEGTREIKELFGDKIFDHPKPTSLLISLIQQGTYGEDDIILDFFAGSGTTAQAVLSLNSIDGLNRHFICVQLPENVETNASAIKEGYKTIADISKDRIRKVIDKLKMENKDQLPLSKEINLGFKNFKLQKSNFKYWQSYQGEKIEELETLFSESESPLVSGWQEKDVLTEVMLLEGFPLSASVSIDNRFTRNKIYLVTSTFCAHHLYICLESEIWEETLEQVGELPKEDIFICLDSALTDESKAHLADVCNLKTI